MCEGKCYLCSKPGKLEKLFRNCKHESACYDCLRDCYVTQAQHVSAYQLMCFHPECNLMVRNTQMKRFVRSEQEMERFHLLDTKAKKQEKLPEAKAKLQALLAEKEAAMEAIVHARRAEHRLGKNWRKIEEALGGAFSLDEIRICGGCGMLVTKNADCCFRMRCICGHKFWWTTFYTNIKQSCDEIEASFKSKEEGYKHLIQFYEGSSTKKTGKNHQPTKKKANQAPLIRIDDEDDDFIGYYDSFEGFDESFDFNEEEECTSSGTLDRDYSISSPSISALEAESQASDWVYILDFEVPQVDLDAFR